MEKRRRKRYNDSIINKNPARADLASWKVLIDLAGISGYNNFEVIYLLEMAFAFPANIQKGLSVDEKIGGKEKGREENKCVYDKRQKLLL